MNRKFDFSEIDGALPDAEKMQERKRMTEALEENCKAVRVLCDRLESECSKLIGRLSAGNRVIISSTAFWCMIEALIFLAAAFICICAANVHLLHSVWLWKLLGSFVVFLAVCIALTVLVCHKLK